MLMYAIRTMYKIMVLLLVALLVATVAGAQDASCQGTLSGRIYDHFSGAPLAYATVFVEETGAGEEADSMGRFALQYLCPGNYHLLVSHIGCHPQRLYLSFNRDTSLRIALEHNEAIIEGVVVSDERVRNAGISQTTLGQQAIEQAAGETLADLAGSVAGVSVLRNGSGIAKPVIHGLSGNRIAILNNGLVQAGQQWGADHAPEIDPFTADKVVILKGVDAIPYGGNTLGGAVLTEPGNIPADPHLHGAVQYVGETNGRMHTLSTRLQRGGNWANWRLTTTFKQAGDHHTPSYFLRNTGLRERNAALLVQREGRSNQFHQLYYSYFYTELGILRGAHVGNLTDLEAAIGRKEPLYTEPRFSYSIEAPRQRVGHHLLKYNYKRFFANNQSFQFTYGGQLNHRREYDVRRGGRSDRPALDLLLQSHFADAHWTKESSGRSHRAGLQLRFNDNYNQPGTGILPLIPNYRLYQPSIYWTSTAQRGKWAWQWGGRYDFFALDVVTFTITQPREVARFYHRFHNYALAAGLQYRAGDFWLWRLNAGLARRAPEANELHSMGLHQGVAGIEEGNPNLSPEQSLKIIWTHTLHWDETFTLEATVYYQLIDNYIFLEPQPERRLTIRGAFPLFIYKQTDARIGGGDLTARYTPTPRWEATVRYALVRGRDLDARQPLVSMPADNVYASIGYDFGPLGKLRENQLSLNARYVWEQTRLLPSQDFLPPPPAYFLLGLQWASELYFANQTIHITLQAHNLLNVAYRDYLNRLRYYADEEGRNLRLNLRWEF